MPKILLDENLPEELGQMLKAHFDLFTVHEMGWATLQNGQLLQAMRERNFEILLTADKSLPFQQNLPKHGIRVAIVRSNDLRFRALVPFFDRICNELSLFEADQPVLTIDLRL